jgi:trehalose/maltose transport system permease protein
MLTRQRVRSAYLFLAPMLLVLARTLYFAFTDAFLADLDAHRFVGLTNFAFLVRDPIWWQAVWNTAVFAVSSVTLELILGACPQLT